MSLGLKIGLSAAAVVLLAAVAICLQWPRLVLRAPPAPPAVAAPQPQVIPKAVNLVAIASKALEACPSASPPVPPDGATATKAQMVAAQSAFKSYDAVTDAYTKCVDAAVEQVAGRYAGAQPAELKSLRAFGDAAHNSAIDQEQTLADQWNAQIRLYKAKHPQP